MIEYRVSVIVPVYNEMLTIEKCINQLFTYQEHSSYSTQLIFVESGSRDGSHEFLRDLASRTERDDRRFIFQEHPLGKGSAISLGLSCSLGEYISIFDADLEYDIADLDYLLFEMISQGEKFVLGTRHKRDEPLRTFNNSKYQQLYYNLGHKIITTYFNLLFGTKLADPATMWKVFDKSIYNSRNFTGERFDFDWELLANFIRQGFIPRELPISYKSRSPQEGKKIRPFRDPLHWVVRIAYFRFRRIR